MRIFERLRERYGHDARQRATELHDEQARLLAEIKSSSDHQAGECCGCSIGHEAAAEPAAAHRR